MTNKIRLLTVIRHPVGGIRTYIKYTYGALDPAKYNITVLTVQDDEGELLIKDLHAFSPEFILIKGRLLELKIAVKLFTMLKNNHFDLIHSQGFTAGILSVFGNVLSRTAHLITSHDVFRADQFPSRFGKLKKMIIGSILSMATKIQSVSEDAQKNLLEFLPAFQSKQEKLVVIRNGIHIESLVNTEIQVPYEFRNGCGGFQKQFIFGFLGRFMPQKGFIYIIDAVEKLSKDKSVVDGFKILAVNDGAYIREYKQIIIERNLDKYFIFRAFLPNVAGILKHLDALVMPSLWEAYGLMAAEALIVGCPVIGSDCIGLREVLRDTPAIMIKMGNAESLASAMKNLMLNPNPVRRKTLEFVPEARKRFNVKKTAHQLDTLFAYIINSKL